MTALSRRATITLHMIEI
jgi:hypothetical protein